MPQPFFTPIDHNNYRGKEDPTPSPGITHLGDGYTRKNGIKYGPVDSPGSESHPIFGTPSKPEDIKNGPADEPPEDVKPKADKPSTDSTQFLKDMKAKKEGKAGSTTTYPSDGGLPLTQLNRASSVELAMQRQLPSEQVALASRNQLFQNGMSGEQRDKINERTRIQRQEDFNLINSNPENTEKFRGLAVDDHEKFSAKDGGGGKTNAEIYGNKGGKVGADGIVRRPEANDRGQVYTDILNNTNIRSNAGNAANDKQNVENLSSAKNQLAFDAITSIPILRPVGLLARGAMLIAARVAAKRAAIKTGQVIFAQGAKNAFGVGVKQFASSPMINQMTTALGGAKGFVPSFMTSLGVSKMATSASNVGNSLLDKDGTANQVVQAGSGLTQAASNFIGFNAFLKPLIKGGASLLGKGAAALPQVAKFFEKPMVKMGVEGLATTAQFGFAAHQGIDGTQKLRDGKIKDGFESLGNAFGISKPGIENAGKWINKFTAAFTRIKPQGTGPRIDIGGHQGPSNTFTTPNSSSTVGPQPQITTKPTPATKTQPSGEPTPATKTQPSGEPTPAKAPDERIAQDPGKNTLRDEPAPAKAPDERIAQDPGKNTLRGKADTGNTGEMVSTKTQEPNITFGKTPSPPNIMPSGKGGGITITGDKGVAEKNGGGVTVTGGKGGEVTTTKQGGAVTTKENTGGGGKPPEPTPTPKNLPKGFPGLPSLGGGGDSGSRPLSQHTSRGLPTQADPSFRETTIEINYFSEMGF